MSILGIICQSCGQAAPRRGNLQKYCEPCSAKKSRLRQNKWMRSNRHRYPGLDHARIKSIAIKQGEIISAAEAEGIGWDASTGPSLEWVARIAIPYTKATSKNFIYNYCAVGHVALRREARSIREIIGRQMVTALQGRKVVTGKLWLDILVQKPSHKSDAVNVVDSICDGLKKAIGLDDRWFCIRRLDWQIIKTNPRIFIGIGQESSEDKRVCSHCGRILPLTHFTKHKGNLLGVGRACADCMRGARSKKEPCAAAKVSVSETDKFAPPKVAAPPADFDPNEPIEDLADHFAEVRKMKIASP